MIRKCATAYGGFGCLHGMNVTAEPRSAIIRIVCSMRSFVEKLDIEYCAGSVTHIPWGYTPPPLHLSLSVCLSLSVSPLSLSLSLSLSPLSLSHESMCLFLFYVFPCLFLCPSVSVTLRPPRTHTETQHIVNTLSSSHCKHGHRLSPGKSIFSPHPQASVLQGT